jgi:hypothetical protein
MSGELFFVSRLHVLLGFAPDHADRARPIIAL